jgi:hypothetical protein
LWLFYDAVSGQDTGEEKTKAQEAKEVKDIVDPALN